MSDPIPAKLLEAYRRARYRVDAGAPFHLRVDARSPPLADLLARSAAKTAAFITAWNPFSEPASEAENQAAQSRLRSDLETLGCVIVPGFGEWEDQPQNGEPSLLAIGIDEAKACELGRRYRQHAILFAREDAIPRLVVLTGGVPIQGFRRRLSR